MINKVLLELVIKFDLENHIFLIEKESIDDDVVKILNPYKQIMIDSNYDIRLCSNDSIVYYNANVESMFRERYRLREYKFFDLHFMYIKYLIDTIFSFDFQLICKNVKREYVKVFFDNNKIKSVILHSLDNESGLFYKEFSNDLYCKVAKDISKQNVITLVLDYGGMTVEYDIEVRILFYILFYHTIMNKVWRANCIYSRENVLFQESMVEEIKLLDRGMTSIVFEEKGKYVGSKYLCDYVQYFPAIVPVHYDYIEQTDDKSMLENAAFKMIQYYNESLPFLLDGRVSGYIIKRDESRFNVPMRWDIIDVEEVCKLLDSYERIIISSDDDELLEFYSILSKQRQVEFLNVENFSDILNGKIDLIITKTDIWRNVPVQSIHIKQLYINVYCMQLRQFFTKKEINYLFYCIPDSNRIFNHRKRVAPESKQHVNNIMEEGGTFTVADGEIDGCIYYNGRRRTTDVPVLWDRTIYFYGPCISIGVFAEDSKTIESFLQRKLNKNGLQYRCVNVPAPLLLNPYDTAINTLHKIGKGKYRKGDVVIHFGRNNLEWYGLISGNMTRHDLSEVFNQEENLRKKIFIGHMAAHVNYEGYEAVSDYIFNDIRKLPSVCKQKSEYCQFHRESFEQQKPELEKYIQYLRKNKFNVEPNSVVGAVAVNANPFTRGHAYLIDEARKKSDYLYVFVAEEDLSDFSFEVRFELVKRYCQQFENVKVLPSGKFFASTISFGDYFNRDALKTVTIDATLDCNIFAKIIAKELDIEFRMLGEEKYDDVTRQYNDFVNEILTQNGVKVIIIPRLTIDGVPVSAKRVREHIRTKNYDALKQEVPNSTYEYFAQASI